MKCAERNHCRSEGLQDKDVYWLCIEQVHDCHPDAGWSTIS